MARCLLPLWVLGIAAGGAALADPPATAPASAQSARLNLKGNLADVLVRVVAPGDVNPKAITNRFGLWGDSTLEVHKPADPAAIGAWLQDVAGQEPNPFAIVQMTNDEYRQYLALRRAVTGVPATGSDAAARALVPDSAEDAANFDATARLVAAGQRWSELRQKKDRTAEEEQELQQLKAELDAGSRRLNEYYRHLYTLLGADRRVSDALKTVKGNVSELQDAVAEQPRTVALYTLVSAERYSVIVVTGAAEVAREVQIPEAVLGQKVAAFQQALRDPHRGDVQALGHDLYQILIAPVASDLAQAQAQTLVWSLDGVLRYIPMGALYDGQHYLVENYATVTVTPASISSLEQKPDFTNLNVAGMGISRQYQADLPELKAVAGELSQVVNDSQSQGTHGVLPGTILLNGAFTETAMEESLSDMHRVVHVASHFVLQPGDDDKSFLLLAGMEHEQPDGFQLTVAEFRDNPALSLKGTDLLTLSACETGVSTSESNGREVDGLAMTAHYKRASAVISSLWEVNDASTGALMADFYRRWADGAGRVWAAAAEQKEKRMAASAARGLAVSPAAAR